MKTVNGIFGFGIVLILFFSVAPATHGFVARAQAAGGTYGVALNSLIYKVHQEQWRIGYRFAAACPDEFKREEEILKERIAWALDVWLQPLRDTYPAALITDKFIFVRQRDFDRNAPIGDDSAALDVRINFECEEGSSSASIGGAHINEVHMRNGYGLSFPVGDPRFDISFSAVLAHEIGHIFDLADTYVEEGARRSTGGSPWTWGAQPDSIMVAQVRAAILEDDKRGIIWLYKHVYEGQPINDCFFSDYVFEAHTAGCIPKHPLIFLVKDNGLSESNGHDVFIKHLLANVPTLDVNAQDDDGFTALHYAVLVDRQLHHLEKPRIVQMLLAHKDIKPYLRNKRGETALDLARAAGLMDIAEMLIAHPRAWSVDQRRKKMAVTWGELKRGN